MIGLFKVKKAKVGLNFNCEVPHFDGSYQRSAGIQMKSLICFWTLGFGILIFSAPRRANDASAKGIKQESPQECFIPPR